MLNLRVSNLFLSAVAQHGSSRCEGHKENDMQGERDGLPRRYKKTTKALPARKHPATTMTSRASAHAWR